MGVLCILSDCYLFLGHEKGQVCWCVNKEMDRGKAYKRAEASPPPFWQINRKERKS